MIWLNTITETACFCHAQNVKDGIKYAADVTADTAEAARQKAHTEL